LGEGEETLLELIASLERNSFERDKAKIEGIKALDATSGQLISTARRSLVKDLDEFPDPDYSFVDMVEYKRIWNQKQGYFSINVSTTRGCPFKCNWCAKPLYGRSYQSRSPERVSKEIAKLISEFGVGHIWFTDDIFGLKSEWIKRFGEECRSNGFKVPYKCLSRADLLLRTEIVQDLADSGCEIVWIGAESGSQKILDSMEKGITVEQIYEAAKSLHNIGINVAFFLQLGYLGESWDDIILTRKLIRECLPDDIGISVSYPLPGTPFFERVKNELGSKRNWVDSADLDLMFPGTYPPGFYRVLHTFLHTEFQVNRILKKRILSKVPILSVLILRGIISYVRLKSFRPIDKGRQERISLSIPVS